MPYRDDLQFRYLDDFPAIVKTFQRPPVNGWGPTYSDDAAIEQALLRAYHEGRMDGISQAMTPSRAPGVPVVDEEPLETLAEAIERLGLRLAPREPPRLVTPVLEPLAGEDWYVWMVRETRRVMGMSLAEADEFVSEVMA